jgi:Apea-like HEPN
MWRSIAPIGLAYRYSNGVLEEPFDFGFGLTLGPAGPLTPKDVDGLGESEMIEIGNRQLAFVVDYENGAEVDPDWLGRGERWRFQTAGHRIHYATLALWLTRKTPLSTQLIAHHVQNRDGVYEHARWPDRWMPYFYSPAQEKEQVTREDLEAAKVRFGNLYRLGPNGVVSITVNLLTKALSDSEAVSRFASLWTCIEALFGPKSPGETTHQLAERIALFLHGHSEQAFEAYRQIKDDYRMRSNVLHGMRFTEREEKGFPQVTDRTEEWLRIPLAKISDDTGLLVEFNDRDKREAFLKRLPFSPDPAGALSKSG